MSSWLYHFLKCLAEFTSATSEPSIWFVGVFKTRALLRHNSYHTFIHLKCTIQWCLVHSQSCAIIATINFRTLSPPQRETPNHQQSLPFCGNVFHYRLNEEFYASFMVKPKAHTSGLAFPQDSCSKINVSKWWGTDHLWQGWDAEKTWMNRAMNPGFIETWVLALG